MTTSPQPSRRLHIALWVMQAFLAFAFLAAGMFKATAPIEELAPKMSWIAHTSPALVRFIGVSEVLGALGLILPAATRILPVLTAVAGASLALVMVLGAATHIALGEVPQAMPALVLGGLAAFVARGRFRLAPIAPR